MKKISLTLIMLILLSACENNTAVSLQNSAGIESPKVVQTKPVKSITPKIPLNEPIVSSPPSLLGPPSQFPPLEPIVDEKFKIFWCKNDLSKVSKKLHIDTRKHIRGVTTVSGFIDAREFDSMGELTGVFLHLDVTGNNTTLLNNYNKNYFTTTDGVRLFKDNERVMLLGSIEKGRFLSTAEFSGVTEQKIQRAIESGEKISLELSFFIRPYEFGLPPNFTAACKIEAL